MKQLVLGTAQLGMNYGIANKSGRPDMKTAEEIVSVTWENGVREFDTAQAYGGSEKVLGEILHRLKISDKATVITKPKPGLDHLDKNAMQNALSVSLENLHCEQLYGYMLHREDLLDMFDKGLGDILQEFIGQGKIRHIGVSVYSPYRAVQALKTKGLDLVQLPSNLLDRRFEDSRVFKLAEVTGKTVYIRSVFLQGLILMDAEALPDHVCFAEPVVSSLNQFCEETGMTRKELAMGYVKKAYPRAKVVFGAETADQVRENLSIWRKGYRETLVDDIQKRFTRLDERVLNPSLW